MADWRPLLTGDMEFVNRIAASVHTALPERAEVFEEKVRLFPQGCRKLVSEGLIVGYGISHPWTLFSIPPLDTCLQRLPDPPQCLYIHDVVVLPAARGQGAAQQYMDYIKVLAREMGISSHALVAVYGTCHLWSRCGFKIVEDASLDRQLQSYGDSAKYMIRSDQA